MLLVALEPLVPSEGIALALKVLLVAAVAKFIVSVAFAVIYRSSKY